MSFKAVSSFCIAARLFAVLWLDVRRLSDSNIRMPENSLDDLVRNSEPIEIRCDSATETVPATPHRQNIIPLVFVVRFGIVLSF